MSLRQRRMCVELKLFYCFSVSFGLWAISAAHHSSHCKSADSKSIREIRTHTHTKWIVFKLFSGCYVSRFQHVIAFDVHPRTLLTATDLAKHLYIIVIVFFSWKFSMKQFRKENVCYKTYRFTVNTCTVSGCLVDKNTPRIFAKRKAWEWEREKCQRHSKLGPH